MFKRVYINHFDYTVKVIDSDFVDIVPTREIDIGGFLCIPEIIAVYRSRKLNVADALARYICSGSFYNITSEELQEIRTTAKLIGIDYERYHKCVANKVERLKWSNKQSMQKRPKRANG
jgi:hypothetical protein